MALFTTADLPPDMQYDPDNPQATAVRGSGLTIECRHGDSKCVRCISEAAKRLTISTEPGDITRALG